MEKRLENALKTVENNPYKIPYIPPFLLESIIPVALAIPPLSFNS